MHLLLLRSLHLLQFLEICIAEFTLWPTYILELLFLKDWAPENIVKVAVFFYGHGVPLGIASCVYGICNRGSHLVPYVMEAFYYTWVTNTEVLHMAQYYNVWEGKILWIIGKNHSRSEIVQPGLIESNIDCRTISQSQIPTLNAEALLAMHLLRKEKVFEIMD